MTYAKGEILWMNIRHINKVSVIHITAYNYFIYLFIFTYLYFIFFYFNYIINLLNELLYTYNVSILLIHVLQHPEIFFGTRSIDYFMFKVCLDTNFLKSKSVFSFRFWMFFFHILDVIFSLKKL